MGDGLDSRLITETRQQAPEHCLEVASLAPASSMRSLIEHPTYVFVAFRRTAAGVPSRALLLSGAGSDPGGELGCGGE